MTAQTSGTADQIRERLRRGEDEARQLGYEVADVAQEIRELAAAEVQLGLAEVKEQVSYAVRGGVLVIAGLVVSELILVFLGLAAMAAIATELEVWAAGLITAAGYLVLTLLLAGIGLFFLKKVTMKPRRLMESLKEDAVWAKSLMKSSKN